MTERVCRRCLLRDDPEQRPLYQVVEEYLQSLPPDLRADQQTYASRLAHCNRCDHLFSGTCALCGCYVEIRCARKALRCPDVPARWQAC